MHCDENAVFNVQNLKVVLPPSISSHIDRTLRANLRALSWIIHHTLIYISRLRVHRGLNAFLQFGMPLLN